VANFAKAFRRPQKSDPMTVPEAERIIRYSDPEGSVYRALVAFLAWHQMAEDFRTKLLETQATMRKAAIAYLEQTATLKSDHQIEVDAIDAQHDRDMAEARKGIKVAVIVGAIGWLAAVALAILYFVN
jgi:hypothetical protein